MNTTGKTRFNKSRIWVAVSIVLMLIGMIGASLVQTSGGRVTVKDVFFETASGTAMSALLLVPDGVSADAPAPGVVVSHGMYNNREMQDLNYVELSRRGYVVLSMDMYSHGKSERVGNIGEIMPGMYAAVSMLSGLDYVDSERVGITGHSLGGMSSNVAVQIDNATDTNLISAVLLNSADAEYSDAETGDWVNIYGARHAGIMAGKYDEWFFSDVDADGNPTAPRDFVVNNNAQSFLNFGMDPATTEQRSADTVYRENIDGVEAMRVIYNPTIIHPWAHFSQQSTEATVDFFNEALDVTDPLPGSHQLWQWKVVFNTIGLIGFGVFLVAFTILLLKTRFFASLRAVPRVAIRETDRTGKIWLWTTLLIAAAFATLVYLPILMNVESNTFAPTPWAQASPWGISVWAATNGVFVALILSVFYFAFMRKRGIGLAERGIIMPWQQVGKTVLLAIIVVAAAFAWVFFADYFFKTDFRIWVLAVKAFPAEIIWVALFPPMVLYLVFFLVASVAVNSINFVKVTKSEKEAEWVNTFILALFNTLPAIIILLVQYISFTSTGFLKLPNMQVVWLFPFLVILPAFTVISRKIYRVTNNPYLGGLICGLVVTFIACANTLTWG